MKELLCYSIGTINIQSIFDLTECVNLLNAEFSNNEINEVSPYYIEIVDSSLWSDTYLNHYTRRFVNPKTKHEKWHYGQNCIEKYLGCTILQETNHYYIYVFDDVLMYSILRNIISEILRSRILKTSVIAIHAALVSKENQYKIIVGSKNSGKTSSVLYAYRNNWTIHTDELLGIDPNGCIVCMQRCPALAENTLKQYFAGYEKYQVANIYNITNHIQKRLLHIPMGAVNADYNNIEQIIALPHSANQFFMPGYEQRILQYNTILGEQKQMDVRPFFNSLVKKAIGVPICNLCGYIL